MKSINAYSINSVLGRTAMVRMDDKLNIEESNIMCEGNVFVEQAYMAQDYKPVGLSRPYIRLIGYVKSIRGNFPYDVGEVTYDARQTQPVEYRYDLTDDELSDLASKGLYNDNFDCPDAFKMNEFILPISCAVVSVPPTDEQDLPLLFVTVNNPYDLHTSSAASGYDITEYFEKPELVRTTDEFKVDELSDEKKEEIRETEIVVEQDEPEIAEEVMEDEPVEDTEVEEMNSETEANLDDMMAEMMAQSDDRFGDDAEDDANDKSVDASSYMPKEVPDAPTSEFVNMEDDVDSGYAE